MKKHVSNSELHSFAIERGRFVDDDECTQPTAPYAFKRDNALASYVALLVSAFTEETIPPRLLLVVALRVVVRRFRARRDSFAVQPLNTVLTRRSNEFPITPDATERITGQSAFRVQ